MTRLLLYILLYPLVRIFAIGFGALGFLLMWIFIIVFVKAVLG